MQLTLKQWLAWLAARPHETASCVLCEPHVLRCLRGCNNPFKHPRTTPGRLAGKPGSAPPAQSARRACMTQHASASACVASQPWLPSPNRHLILGTVGTPWYVVASALLSVGCPNRMETATEALHDGSVLMRTSHRARGPHESQPHPGAAGTRSGNQCCTCTHACMSTAVSAVWRPGVSNRMCRRRYQ